jgi:hypothetical protein
MEGSLGIFSLVNSVSFVKDGFLPEIFQCEFQIRRFLFFRME